MRGRLAGIGRLALAFACFASPAAYAGDVVKLRNGTEVEGRVVFEAPDKVIVRMGSRDREIPRAEVDTVRSAARALRETLERWDALQPNDSDAVLELARSCKANGLESEARLLALHVLSTKPDETAAHELCGHEKRGQQWFVREGSKRHPFDKLGELRKDWGKAWEIETTHFSLRTNLDLGSACAAALELELAYRAFFEWFADDLALYEVVETMKAEIHAAKGSFPETGGRKAYFSSADNVLYVDASDELSVGALVHEATHQLLYATSSDARGSRGAVPAWLDEGLAEYTSWSRQGALGRARYSKGAPAQPHFARHRGEEKPYDLSRILSLESGDFLASSKADLKYSQAYTLVHFCMHGDNERYQRGLLAFLRGAYDGQGSMTDFKKTLGFKERDFEKAWHEYAKVN